MIVNFVPTKTGKVRAACEHRDRRSTPVEPDSTGEPHWNPRGWSCAPYSPTTQHADGSFGTLWTCPSCTKLRDQRRQLGIYPLLFPSAARQAARANAAI